MEFELDRVEVFAILEALTAKLGSCQECEEKTYAELVKRFADKLNEHMQKPQVAAVA
jgi:formylmethanofuran dehydrogenase subunit E